MERIAHLFFPRESNNQKAKLLHPIGLGVLATLVIAFQVVLNFVPKTFPQVLGYAANIIPFDIVKLTNEKRAQNGMHALVLDSTLSAAAIAKGNDMLAKGYWAHFAPDGTSPWSFFLSFGYKYKYAGENLARDFASSQAAMDAWMNSPSHKDNILNDSYNDIGIGVVEGKLNGVDTTIIVQFFGTKMQTEPSVAAAQFSSVLSTPTPSTLLDVAKEKSQEAALPITIETPEPTPSPTPESTPTPEPTFIPVAIASTDQVTSSSSGKLSPFLTTKNIAIAVVAVLLLVLAIDIIVIRQKRINRVGGRTLAHLGFFGMIFAVIIILKAGKII